MKKQLVIIGVLVLFAAGFCGCTSNPFESDRDKLIGSWSGIMTENFSTYSIQTPFSVTLWPDGTYTYTRGNISDEGTWEIEYELLSLLSNSGNISLNYYLHYTFQSSTTLRFGNKITGAIIDLTKEQS